MRDDSSTRGELATKLAELRQRIAELEAAQTKHRQTEEALRQRNLELELLNRAGQAFSSTLDLDQVLATVLQEMCRLLGVTASSVWLLDPETGELVCRQAAGPKSEIVCGWRLAPGQGIAGWVASNATSLIVPDTRADDRYFEGVGKEIGVELRSILGVPMRIKQDVIGVLQVVDTETDRFQTADLTLLKALAASAATAVENARLYEAVQQELTERQRTEQTLREREERLRSIFENAAVGIAVVDMAGRFIEFNDTWRTMLGYDREELLNLSIQDVTPAGEPMILPGKGREGEEYPRIEKRYLRKDGSEFWGALCAGAIHDQDGTMQGMVGTIVDITERKRLEQQTEERHLYLEGVLAYAPDAIVTLDAQHNILEWNPGAEQLFGYSKEEAVGRNIDDLVTGSDVGAFEEATGFTHRVLDGETIGPIETIRYRKDGTPVDVIVAGAPILVRDELAGVVALYTDITENKRVEEEIQQRTAQLEALREVGLELTAQLDLEPLLHSIVSRAVELLEGTSGGIYLYRPDRDVLEWTLAVGSNLTSTGTVLRRGEGLSGKVWETGEPFIVDDYRHWEGRATTLEEYPFTAIVGVPVRWAGESLGVLDVFADPPRTFSAADAELLSLFATQAAIAIRNAQLYREAQLRAERLATINRIARAVSATLDLDDLVEIVYREIDYSLEADAVFIALYDQGANELDFRLQVDEGVREPPERRPMEPGLTASVITEKKPLLIRNFEEERDRLPPAKPWGTMKVPSSWLGVPLQIGDRVVGIFSVQAYRPNAYGEEEQLLLSTIADQVVIAVDNARLYAEQRRRAEEASLVLEIASAVSSTLELNDILKEVALRAARACDAQRCTIVLLDEQGKMLLPTMSQFASGQVDPELWRLFRDASYPQPVESVPEAVQVIQERQPLFLPDAHTSSLPRQWIEPFDMGSVLIVPLTSREQVVGLMGMDRREPHSPFTSDQVNLAMTIATQAAIALENSRLFQGEREQRELTEALEEAASAVSGTLELDQVLDRILEETERVVAGDAFNIMLIEDENARVVRHRGYESVGAEDWITTFSPPIARYPFLLRMVQTRRPVVVPDTAADPDWIHEEGQEWLRSYVGTPIQVAGLGVGFLNVDGTRPGQFGPNEARRLEAFAHHAAIAIENARLYRETAHRLAQAHVLREVMLAAASTLNFDRVLERTCETLQTMMQVEFLGFGMPDEEVQGLRLHSSLIGYPASVKGLLLPLDGSLCGRVFQTGEPMVIGDVREIPDYYEAAPEVRSELAVPMCVGQQVIGVLNVESSQLAAFDLDDLAFYTAIAGHLGRALENARLYQEVRRQADELAAAVERLQELDHLKSEFIQNVSHELRSPLALIRGYGEMLDAGELGELATEQREPVKTIARRARMLGDLVEDITLLLAAEARALEEGPVALDDLVRAAVEDFGVAVDKAGLTLTEDITPDLPPVRGVPLYIRRVVDNLLSNAIKFTPSGGKVGVRVWHVDEQVALEVTDTGIGISPEQQEHIFERFYQVDGSARRRYGGVGLGLALVKEIVEAYDGRVDVESRVGKGSAFTVTLPVFEE